MVSSPAAFYISDVRASLRLNVLTTRNKSEQVARCIVLTGKKIGLREDFQSGRVERRNVNVIYVIRHARSVPASYGVSMSMAHVERVQQQFNGP